MTGYKNRLSLRHFLKSGKNRLARCQVCAVGRQWLSAENTKLARHVRMCIFPDEGKSLVDVLLTFVIRKAVALYAKRLHCLCGALRMKFHSSACCTKIRTMVSINYVRTDYSVLVFKKNSLCGIALLSHYHFLITESPQYSVTSFSH
jgi:hypothetical protein